MGEGPGGKEGRGRDPWVLGRAMGETPADGGGGRERLLEGGVCNGKDPQAPLEPIRDPHGTGHAMRLWERGKQWETPRMGEQGRGYGGRGGSGGVCGGGERGRGGSRVPL